MNPLASQLTKLHEQGLEEVSHDLWMTDGICDNSPGPAIAMRYAMVCIAAAWRDADGLLLTILHPWLKKNPSISLERDFLRLTASAAEREEQWRHRSDPSIANS
jgi:hypothetical protein